MGKFIVDESTANTLVRVWEDETAQLSFQQQVVSKMPILDDATSQIRVVFDGIDDHMIGALPSPISTDDCTLIYVGKATLPESGVGVICSFYDDDPANDFYYVRFGSIDGVPTCWYGNGVDTEVTLQATGMDFTADLDYEWAFTADPVSGERTFWVDGVAKDTSTTELSATINNVQLGANGDNNYTVSEAGAVVSYSVFKTTSELSDINTYLFDRYGLDTEAPTVGDATITISDTGSTTVTLQWNQATDNVTAQGSIDYEVYYSTADNISTYENAVANGTLFEIVTGGGESTITQLDPETQYYVNVFAKDAKNNVLEYTSNNTTTLADDSFVAHRDFSEYVDSSELQAEWTTSALSSNTELITDDPSPIYTNIARFTPDNNGRFVWVFNPFNSAGRKDELKQFTLLRFIDPDGRIGGQIFCSPKTLTEIDNDSGSGVNGAGACYALPASLQFGDSRITDTEGWRFPQGSTSPKNSAINTWTAIYTEKFPENGQVRVRCKFWTPADPADPEADIPASWDIDNLYSVVTDEQASFFIDNNAEHAFSGILGSSVNSGNRQHDVGFYSVATGSENVLFKPPV